jgi:hypothetical protein
MRNVILLLISISLLSCKNKENPIKQELYSVLNVTGMKQIEIVNSNFHNGMDKNNLLSHYELEENGVHLHISQAPVGELVGEITSIYIPYDKIQSIYKIPQSHIKGDKLFIELKN